jgi:pimeloyl-ACP methyl ester carboxylesterase
LAARHPDRVRSAVLGGVGIKLVEVAGLHHDVARSLELPSIDDVTDPQGKAFRLFAEQTQSDLRALAACLRGSRQTLQRDELAVVRAPVLVAAGTRDDIAGSPAGLAALFPDGQALDIPNRDHMVAVGDRVFKAAVLEFLKNRP